jgi:hypothetical protein
MSAGKWLRSSRNRSLAWFIVQNRVWGFLYVPLCSSGFNGLKLAVDGMK